MSFIKKYWKVVSIVAILFSSLLYFFCLVGIKSDNQENWLNLLSILSSFSSVVGILIALWQIGEISNDLKEYKNMQTLKKQSVVIEKIRTLKLIIREENIDYLKVIYQVDYIKEFIVKTTPELKDKNNRYTVEELERIKNILIKPLEGLITEDSKKDILAVFEGILEYLYKLD